ALPVKYQGLIRPKFHRLLHFRFRIISENPRISFYVLRTRPGNRLSVEIAYCQKVFILPASPVSEDRRISLIHRSDVSVSDHIVLLAQADQLLIIMENGIRILQLAFGVDPLRVLVDTDPRRSLGKSAVLTSGPLHGRASVVS